MKSRTSFFNPTVFKKDITRFAPVWVLYSLGLVMALTVLTDRSTDYIQSLNLASLTHAFAVVHLCYALLNAQLLFGDLYSPRLCNALHAMPLRRECWFCTKVVSGLLFALVPTAVFSLIMLPLLGTGWSVALWFLLGTTMEYLFFFGVAVFSIMLAGNRFAQVLIYGLINFLSILAYWFAGTLFEPLMYGVTVGSDPFTIWCPTYSMLDEISLINVVRTEHLLPDGGYDFPGTVERVALGSDWWYLAVCAALGIALAAAALALYRRRRLESAGDFIAVKAVEPVFLVLFTLGVGAFFQLFGRAFESVLEYVFLAVGLGVGYFIGRMMLMRTTRVFQKKAFLGLGAIAAALVLSIALVAVDAFGIVRHVPDREDVDHVTFTNGYYHGSVGEIVLREPEDVENVLEIHRYAIDNIPEGWDRYYSYSDYYKGEYYTYFYLTYMLTDGSTLERRYSIPVESAPGEILKDYYSRVEYVLGVPESELPQMAAFVNALYVDGNGHNYESLASMDVPGLLNAIAADCRNGNMIQDWSYHGGEDSRVYIEIEYRFTDDRYNWAGLYVYDSCENTLNWLTENGFEIGEAMYGG